MRDGKGNIEDEGETKEVALPVEGQRETVLGSYDDDEQEWESLLVPTVPSD